MRIITMIVALLWGGVVPFANAATPNEFVRDSFKGTAGTELTQHIGEVGAVWTAYLSPDKTKIFGGKYVLSSGQALRHADSLEGYYSSSGAPASDEYDVSATIRKLGNTTSRIGAGISARMSLATTTFYVASYYNDTGGHGEWLLAKFVNGKWSQLGLCAMDLVPGQDYRLTLQVRNAEKRLLVNNELCAASTDNTIIGAGRVGVHTESNASTDSSGLTLDNFSATETIAGGSATVAENVTMSVAANGSFTGRFPATGTGALNFQIVATPSKGVATLQSASSGQFTYKVNAGATGSDSVSFKVTDLANQSSVGVVSILIDEKVTFRDPIMVIAAHPDDEALIASGVIVRALATQQPVKVVVVTNGDKSETSGLAREAETVSALTKLGVAEDDIIFLGYPDDFSSGLRSIYNSYLTISSAYNSADTGHTTTYGNRGLGRRDFSSYRNGTSAKYNKPNILDDLSQLLVRYSPRKIYTHSIADEHPDHRIVYQYVVDAVRSVMNLNGAFLPDVYTQIVHSPTGYPFVDKWAVGATPTAQNSSFAADSVWPAPAFSGIVGNYADLIARFAPDQALTEPPDLWRTSLLWDERVSVPVPNVLQTTTKSNNPKFNAVDSYVSQRAGSNGIIYAFGKLDEVFWVNEWSKNIAPAATVTASSQNAGKFQMAANVTDGVIDGNPGDYQAEWVTADAVSNPVGQALTLTWLRPYTISEIRLYDRPLLSKQITGADISFDDGGPVVSVGSLPNIGFTPRIVTLPTPRTARRLTVLITGFQDASAIKGNAGLAEVEVIGVPAGTANRPPLFSRGPYVVGSNYTVSVGSPAITIQAPALDPDGDILTYSWRATRGNVTSANGAAAYTPPVTTGLDTVTVTISDGVNLPVSAQISINVIAGPGSTTSGNLALSASVAVSSQNTSTTQLGVKAIDGIVDGYPGDYTKEWATLGEKVGAWIELSWKSAVNVGRVVLHDRPNTSEQIMAGTLTFSDGSSVAVGSLPNNGTGLTLIFPARSVSWLRFTVTSVSSVTRNVGLAEIETYAP